MQLNKKWDFRQTLMKLTLGFSPCPNDTFIFDAMIHGRIDTEGLTFEVVMEDVEALNQRAFQKDLDVTKLSYFVELRGWPHVKSEYVGTHSPTMG